MEGAVSGSAIRQKSVHSLQPSKHPASISSLLSNFINPVSINTVRGRSVAADTMTRLNNRSDPPTCRIRA
ncbi:hypothetical protein D3C73_1597690 [compost metagenome]